MRAAHVHVIVAAPGFRPVTTHIFDAADQYLESDAVFGVRDSLIWEFRPAGPGDPADVRFIVDANFALAPADQVS